MLKLQLFRGLLGLLFAKKLNLFIILFIYSTNFENVCCTKGCVRGKEYKGDMSPKGRWTGIPTTEMPICGILMQRTLMGRHKEVASD